MDELNNVSAFPYEEHGTTPDGYKFKRIQSGMTLRDYFAAKAMSLPQQGDTKNYLNSKATLAYQMADAMLKARE